MIGALLGGLLVLGALRLGSNSTSLVASDGKARSSLATLGRFVFATSLMLGVLELTGWMEPPGAPLFQGEREDAQSHLALLQSVALPALLAWLIVRVRRQELGIAIAVAGAITGAQIVTEPGRATLELLAFLSAAPIAALTGAYAFRRIRVTSRFSRIAFWIFAGSAGPMLFLPLIWAGDSLAAPSAAIGVLVLSGVAIVGIDAYAEDRNALSSLSLRHRVATQLSAALVLTGALALRLWVSPSLVLLGALVGASSQRNVGALDTTPAFQAWAHGVLGFVVAMIAAAASTWFQIQAG